MLLVESECTSDDYSRQRMWVCRCDCGNIVKLMTSKLTCNLTISCGCHAHTGKRLDRETIVKLFADGMPAADIARHLGCTYQGVYSYLVEAMVVKTGNKRLVAGRRINSFVLVRPSKPNWWLCKCDCGREFEHHAHHITRKNSCGCSSRSSYYSRQFNRSMSVWMRRANRYRAGAKRRGLEYTLTVEDVKGFLESPCYYCGKEPDRNLGHYVLPTDDPEFKKVWSATKISGIDRINNARGYQLLHGMQHSKTG